MFQAKTGSSVKASAFDAGKEAATEVKRSLDSVNAAFVYASCAYDLDALLKGLRAELPGVPFIGNTSFTGVITPDGFISGPDGFVGLMAISDPDLAVGVAAVKKTDSAVEAGRQAAQKAILSSGRSGAPTYFYMTAPPGEEEYYL